MVLIRVENQGDSSVVRVLTREMARTFNKRRGVPEVLLHRSGNVRISTPVYLSPGCRFHYDERGDGWILGFILTFLALFIYSPCIRVVHSFSLSFAHNASANVQRQTHGIKRTDGQTVGVGEKERQDDSNQQ